MGNHYETLGVNRDAPEEVVQAAYRALSSKYHPDRNGGDTSNLAKLKAINEAYDVLRNKEKRTQYDSLLTKEFSHNHSSSKSDASNATRVKIIFAGDSYFDRDEFAGRVTRYTTMNFHVDSKRVGGGPGDRGFSFEFDIEPGLHEFSLRWKEVYDGEYTPDRSDFTAVIKNVDKVTLRLSYSSNFYVSNCSPENGAEILTPKPSVSSGGCVPVLFLGVALSFQAVSFLLSLL